MKIYIDIDNTILTQSKNCNYKKAKPIIKNIEKANKLYDEGHHIVYWTARGSVSGEDWTELTKSQFEKYGVKYHELRFKNPAYDVMICDRCFNSFEALDLEKIEPHKELRCRPNF